jgi:hypothetical protein
MAHWRDDQFPLPRFTAVPLITFGFPELGSDNTLIFNAPFVGGSTLHSRDTPDSFRAASVRNTGLRRTGVAAER